MHAASAWKQSCPSFSFFGRLPGFNRLLRCSKSFKRQCLEILIINVSVVVQCLQSIQHGKEFQRGGESSD